MPISSHGVGIEVPGREDIKPIYTSATWNGEQIFEYDEDTNTLRLNKYMFSLADLEEKLEQTEVLPEGGLRFVLPLPLQEPAVFEPVRKIEYIPEGIDLVTRVRNRRGYFSEYFQMHDLYSMVLILVSRILLNLDRLM